MIGIEPPTEASYKKETLFSFANAISSSKCSAISFLLAETTCFPLDKASRTIANASLLSLINSTTRFISLSSKISLASKPITSLALSLFLFLSLTTILLILASNKFD